MVTQTMEPLDLRTLVSALGGPIAARCGVRLLDAGEPLLVTKQTANNLARTFAGKYSWARDAGHVVNGLEETVLTLEEQGESTVRAVFVDGADSQFVVILDNESKRSLSVMEVVPQM